MNALGRSLAAGVFACILSAGSALADITIIDNPPFPGNPDQNVLFPTNVAGTTLFGVTNQTNSSVTFNGLEQLVAPPNGQARIEATDGGLVFLEGFLTDPLMGFTSIEFNLNAAADGDAVLTFFDNLGGAFSDTFTLGASGSNFFTAVATNGQIITRFTIDSATPLQDVAQIRLGGVGLISAIPEPATWLMMILGFGMVGAGLRMVKRQTSLTAA